MTALMEQHETWKGASARLWGAPRTIQIARVSSPEKPLTLPAQPAASPRAQISELPRNGTTVFRKVERAAVAIPEAMEAVSAATDIPKPLMLKSRYSAAIAARHMLYAVLADGGHSVAFIARHFHVDREYVEDGIAAFRAFEKQKAAAQ